jgi:hypothetical protein
MRHVIVLSGTPYALHPTPYTLHPEPYTLHPTPYILHPTPLTPHPTPYTETSRCSVSCEPRYRQVASLGQGPDREPLVN